MATIAGAEAGRPTGIDEVTPEWLTTVLRTSGAIPSTSSVASVANQPFAEGLGFLSHLYESVLTYEGTPGPDTVIVKFATEAPSQRGIADGLALYQRELRFYREVAERIPLRTPKVHASVMDPETTEFVLVMEDLSALRPMDQITGAGRDDAVRSASALAKFQSAFWGADLSDLETTFFPLDNPIHQVVLPQIFGAGWERCKAEGTDVLTPELIAFGDRYVELLPWMLGELSTGQTLVHGDWRADNLLVDGDTPAVVDFQLVGTAAGAYDLAYFMSQSIEPEVRRACEGEVLDAYYGGLDDAGAPYDFVQSGHEFRIAAAFCLIYPVSIFGGWDDVPENGQKLMLAGLRRSVTTIVDHDSLALVPGSTP